MSTFTRRQFIHSTSAAAAGLALAGAAEAAWRIATFRFDVTPPIGHPLCGGWITPMVDCADPLQAIGFVLLGAGEPIVVCAVDWTGILNEAHVAWRAALAEAAGTTPERVAVQCVHQHDAPFACLRSERLMAEQAGALRVVDPAFFQACVSRAQTAVKEAIGQARPVTHVATGAARVEKVASNRRVSIGPDGKVRAMRGSSCTVPELIALPEGLVDPILKTVAFYDGAEKILACHYYATHPMSHYGKGHVSSDFVGLARRRRQEEEPGCCHVYFTGAAGNIAAGKYNNGSPEARVELTTRMHEALAASEASLQPKQIRAISWKTHEILPPPNPLFVEAEQRALLADPAKKPAARIIAAMRVAFLERLAAPVPIVLSALHVNDTSLLHLPAECFVEYQLRAQQLQPGRFIATAAYGDGGPWYIPTKEAYPQGGYEVSVANCADAVDDVLGEGLRRLI